MIKLNRLFELAWNAAFTQHGRRNVATRCKLQVAKMSGEWKRGEPMPYRLKDGTRFVVHSGNALSELIYTEGAYEPLETRLVRSVIGAGDVFVDIGANVGFFTAVAAAVVGTEGGVHSFEPGPGTFAALQKTIAALGLGNVKANNLAVADQPGTLEFWTSLGGGDAQQSLVNVAGLNGNARKETVEAVSLDSYLAALTPAHRERLTMVKCDVEGAEVRVLDGARQLLQSADAPLWLIEHNRPALIEQGFASADLCSRFAGYTLFFVPLAWPPGVSTVKSALPMRDPAQLPDECNLLAIPARGRHRGNLERLVASGLLESPSLTA